jgi:transketolase
MRAIPNMTMIVPADADQCAKIVEASIAYPGPIYIRMARGEEPTAYDDFDYEFIIGKANMRLEGTDFTIVGCGIGVYMGVVAAQKLAEEGVSVRVLDMHTLKPMDDDAILAALKETRGIVTVEDQNIIGGLGDGVASVIAESGIGTKFKKLGIPDVFPALGYPEELYDYYGYGPDGIVAAVKSLL